MSFRTKQVLSVILTIAVYTALLNWKVAILLAGGVAFHEYGHLWAARQKGLPTKGFFLLPFMGGAALIAGRYKSYREQAFVALMGPVWGGALAFISFGVYGLTHQVFFLKAASWMALLNLLNLFPLSFLDGGQLMGTVTYSINQTLGTFCKVISTVIAAIVITPYNFIIGSVIAIFGGASAVRELKNWNNLRKGNEWLVDEDYLYPPEKMFTHEIAFWITAWLVTGITLLLLAGKISQMPGGNWTELFR